MELSILLLLIPSVLGYVEQYKGFNTCGVGGWSCNYSNAFGGFEITYQCNVTGDSNARVWVWTARLPSGAKTFTIKNCAHVEVHIDCTKGTRTNILSHFRVINVAKLEFLQPLVPGIFLHDNDKIPQAPPFLHIENVENTNFYPGMFDPPGGGCRYKNVKLTNLLLKNVKLDKLEKSTLQEQSMDSFEFSEVIVKDIESRALIFTSNNTVNISKCKFPTLPPNSILIKGKNVSITENSFSKIATSGLTVFSKEFLFRKNNVSEVEQKGIDVLAAKIQLTENYWTHLNTGAFEKLTPGYIPQDYELPSKFIYNFSNNIIEDVNPGAFNNNWEIYKNLCKEIITQSNVFDCSCVNLGWLGLNSGLGPKISAAKGFYDEFLKNENNICKQNTTCSIATVIDRIQDICQKNTTIESVCSAHTNTTHKIEVPPVPIEITTQTAQQTTTEIPEVATEILSNDISETRILTNNSAPLQISISENHTEVHAASSLTWVIIAVVLTLVAATTSAILIFWFKRRRSNENVRTFYEKHKGIEADSLVIENEHHNVLFR